jgi:predicted RNA methylase
MLSTGTCAIEAIIENIGGETSKIFYDLGSGNGRVVAEVVHHCPNMKCIGVEYNIGAYILAKVKNIFLRKKVTFVRSNFFDINLANADIVYVYLFPKIIKRLEEKFSRELKKGTIVIANTFPLGTRKPKKIIPNEKGGSLDILYVYEF